MANLAIKGHPIRGKEVIEILEMLGGKNKYQVTAFRETYIYFVDKYKNIDLLDTQINQIRPEQFIVFTLEGFLEKYPFKVGDKVSVCEYETKVCIEDMKWDGFEIQYSVSADSADETEYLYEWYSVEEINKYNEHYKEETIETDVNDNKTLLNMSAIDYNNGLVGYEIPVGYEFDTVFDNKVILKKLKLQYPKNYAECCNVMGVHPDNYISIRNLYYDDGEEDTTYYEQDILGIFDYLWKLRICRDAYWKIAGEQMGLKEPWKPDWDSLDKKYDIYNYRGDIKYDYFTVIDRCLLVFPTEEIRDAFYENFKDLIENCKEFL